MDVAGRCPGDTGAADKLQFIVVSRFFGWGCMQPFLAATDVNSRTIRVPRPFR